MKKLLALLLALCLPLTALAQTVAPGATITVTGSASVSVPADCALISVGVTSTANTVDKAVNQNNKAIRNVIKALKDAGIPEADIVTDDYSVYSDCDYDDDGVPYIISYQVTNLLSITLRDMDAIGKTLDKAIAAGANSIQHIEFRSTKAAQVQDEAMACAVQDALRRAQLLADAAGVTLGGILAISDTAEGWGGSATAFASALDAGASANVILPDSAEFSTVVSIVFELK